MIPNRIVNSHYGPMIINGNDKWIGPSIEQFGAWAADDIEVIKNIMDVQLRERQYLVFYDVGANIGTHTVALGRHFQDRIRIRSFEAQRQIYYVLCGNVAINGLDNVVCHHCAVGDGASQTMEIALPDYTKTNNFGGLELIEVANSDNSLLIKNKTEKVDCLTLDGFDEAVDFIKLDIEGMEYHALQGAQQLIQKSRPICFVEVLKSDVDKIQKFFRHHNYVKYAYKPEDWIFVPKESDVELDLPQ